VGQLPHGTGLAFYVSGCIGKVAIRYGTEVNLFFFAKPVVPLKISIQFVHIRSMHPGNKTHIAYPLARSFVGLLIFR